MSVRRRWLVAYDISDEVRLRRVRDIVRSHGERLQYSVFLCDLTSVERVLLKSELRDAINQRQDSVVFINLGAAGRGPTIEAMGRRIHLPNDGPLIV